jgi:dTDP-4-dehydrorhamnose reductase
MRVAVIGSQGQLGTDLVELFSSCDRYQVTPLAHPQIEVTDRDSLASAIIKERFAVVVNCAAFTRVEECEDSPGEALLVNGQGAFEVARACAASGALCVHVSTDYVFSGDKGLPYSEDDPVGPINVYGTSKLAGELLVRQAADRWLIVRISSVFGKAGSRAKGGNFVETILSKARASGQVKIVNDIWMSPTYTRDAAHCIEELIRLGAAGLFHAPNGGRCTWFEFGTAVLKMAGINASAEPVSSASYPTKARRPRDSSLSNNRLEKLLRQQIRPWEDALKAYLTEMGYVKGQGQTL